MASPLIPLHALIGWLGSVFFLWAAVELLRPISPREPALGRVHIAILLGTLAILLSWVMGGYYYVETYGTQVKPLVKGVAAWVHDIGMETKEHVFLFMPFLAFLTTALVRVYGRDLERVRGVLFWLSLSLFLLGTLVAVEGYLVSNAARTALEVVR